MKKRILSLLLTLTMLLGMVPAMGTTASAMPEGTPLSGDIGDYTITSNGVYYLSDDTTGNITVNDGATVTIDLNGHVLKAKSSNSVITNNGTLYVIDGDTTPTTRYFTDEKCIHGYDIGICCPLCGENVVADGCYETCRDTDGGLTAGSYLTVKGGCITGGISMAIQSVSRGGGIYNTGSLTVIGVSFVGNWAANGGGIYNESGSLSVSGGSIVGNSASDGGGVYSSSGISLGTFTAMDCDISHNTAASGGGVYTLSATKIYNSNLENNYAENGGAVYAQAYCLIQGCTIRNNTASNVGGGISINDDTVDQDGIYLILADTDISENSASSNGGGVYASGTNDSCFVEGTKITMADGSLKNIEDVEVGDDVRTFDHEAGTLSSEKVCLVFGGTSYRAAAALHFTNGVELTLIGEHDLLEKITRKYVELTPENAESFVGKWFYNANAARWEQLLNVSVTQDNYSYYALLTQHHLNCVANDMLTVVYEASMLLNLYELDENLKADADTLQSDVQTYGLRDLQDCLGATEEEYDTFNLKYWNIILGKNVCSEAFCIASLRFAESVMGAQSLSKSLLHNGMNEAQCGVLTASLVHFGTAVDYSAYTTNDGSLILGSDVTVRSNTAAGKDNNVYLAANDGGDATIMFAGDVIGIDVGVSMANGFGQFTTNGVSADTQYFFSDSDGCVVHYNSNGYLELIGKVEATTDATTSYYTSIENALEHDEGDASVIPDGETEDEPTVIKLLGDDTENVTIPAGRNITIDLNGFVLKGDGSDSVITNNGTLYIADSDTAITRYFTDVRCAHGILVGESCENCGVCPHGFSLGHACEDCLGWEVGLSALLPESKFAKPDGCYETYTTERPANMTDVLTVKGGCITGGIGAGSGEGGGVTNNGAFSLESGNIIGNSLANSDGCQGGGVSNSGTFVMNGGCIIGNHSYHGGAGVFNYGFGTFTLNNGSISRNSADESGGGLGNDGTFIMNGGYIGNNAAIQDGGGVYNNGYMTVTGGSITQNAASRNGGGVYVSENAGCFAEGTKIAMADGSVKNIEDVAEGDYVKSFNHETGKYESNKVLIAYEGEREARYITLHFTNGVDLGIYDCHALFEQSANRYVTVSENNAGSFIGKRFYNAATGTWEELLSVTRSSDVKKYYSLYVAKTFNCLANGMLSVPDDDLHLDMYTFNADLTVNQAVLQVDIAKYGICKLEDCHLITTQEEYEALAIKYYNIMLGKGLATAEEVEEAYYEWYADGEEQPGVLTAKSVQNDAPYTLTASLVQYGTAEQPPLTIGGTAKITGNTADGKANNVYLASGKTITIDSTEPLTTNASIGVTTEITPTEGNPAGITVNGASTDLRYFKSDSRTYEVKFDTDHLVLAVKQTPTSSNSGSSTITVPVSGDKDTVKVSATVSGSNATINNVTSEEITQVGTGDTVVVNLTGLDKSVTGVTIPKTTFENVAASSAKGLEVKLPNGTVAVFDKTTLKAVASQAKDANIQLVVDRDSKAEQSMTRAQKEAVSEMNKPVVLDAYFVSNGVRISDFKGGEANITATYETTNPVRVWYVTDDGTKELVPSTFDGKVASFTVTHFSHYVIEMLDGTSYDSCPQDSTCVYAKFSDANPKEWYHSGVHFCVEYGYMKGVDNGLFAPNGTLSRAMIVTMLWRMEGSPVVNYAMSFKDVPADFWYTEAIRWAQSTGVVLGYDESTFGPEDNVTREQLAAILWRYAKLKGYDVSVGEDTNILSYDDAIGGISEYAIPAMQWACGAGIINGIGTRLEARGFATRAQAACMIQRFCVNVAK